MGRKGASLVIAGAEQYLWYTVKTDGRSVWTRAPCLYRVQPRQHHPTYIPAFHARSHSLSTCYRHTHWSLAILLSTLRTGGQLARSCSSWIDDINFMRTLFFVELNQLCFARYFFLPFKTGKIIKDFQVWSNFGRDTLSSKYNLFSLTILLTMTVAKWHPLLTRWKKQILLMDGSATPRPSEHLNPDERYVISKTVMRERYRLTCFPTTEFYRQKHEHKRLMQRRDDCILRHECFSPVRLSKVNHLCKARIQRPIFHNVYLSYHYYSYHKLERQDSIIKHDVANDGVLFARQDLTKEKLFTRGAVG